MGGCVQSCLKSSSDETSVEFSSISKKGGNVSSNNPTEKATSSKSKYQASEERSAVESESSSDDDEMEDIPQSKLQSKKGHTTVSAEAYGTWNKKSDFKPKVISKTSEQKERIIARLEKAFMFNALDDKERDIVINAMEEKRFKDGEYVIKQGEHGDVLFVVDSGKLDCFKKFNANEPEKYLKTYQPGESFGELALLYNVPRAASIKAVSECVLWQLDRETFNAIVKDSAIKKRQRYEEFLKSVSILESMDDYERSKIADILKTIKYSKGEYIIRQGETGNTFFFIEQGTAKATKKLSPNGEEETVLEYKEGDYFGELALLKDQPRAANVIATSELILASVDRESFKRVLGPLEDIMKRNTSKYKGYSY